MNKFRLGIGILLFWLMLLPLAAKQVQAAGPNIQLMIGGETYRPEVPPKIVDGRTLVPIRVVAEAFGAKVDWDDKQKKVKVTGDAIELTMLIGSSKATVKGREVVMDTPPKIDNDRTLVPLRFIGDSLGVPVGWEASSRTVVVNEPYTLTANGKIVEENVFNINDELYFPLKALSVNIGAELSKQSNEVDRFVMNDLDLILDGKGQKKLKLKKMDTGWVIPKSTLEDQLQVSVTVKGKHVQVERLSQLKSVREAEGKVYIDFTLPTSSKHFFMSSPDRIVIDLPNMILGDELKRDVAFNGGNGVIQKGATVIAAAAGNEIEQPFLHQPISDGVIVEPEDELIPIGLRDSTELISSNHDESLIKEIRYSQFSNSPQTVRVVVELTKKANYDLLPAESGFVISLKSTPRNEEPAPKKEGFLIYLDAGHGGKDPGAKGVSGNVEKDLTLAVSNYLAEELAAYQGLQIVQSRTGDTYTTPQERAQQANEVSADLFLSIHGNSFKNPETRGTETFYYTSQSEKFAKVLHKHLLQATGFPDRKVKVSGFYVIKNTNMPSALVELGFLSNGIENTQLKNPEFQKAMAKALAEAIYEYYTS